MRVRHLEFEEACASVERTHGLFRWLMQLRRAWALDRLRAAKTKAALLRNEGRPKGDGA